MKRFGNGWTGRGSDPMRETGACAQVASDTYGQLRS